MELIFGTVWLIIPLLAVILDGIRIGPTAGWIAGPSQRPVAAAVADPPFG